MDIKIHVKSTEQLLEQISEVIFIIEKYRYLANYVKRLVN